MTLTAFIATSAWAQKNGIKISVNACPQWNGNLGTKIGADALIPFGQSRWGLEPGLYWSFRNVLQECSNNNSKEEYNDRVYYLELPLRVAVRLAGDETSSFCMYGLFGPYFSYGIGGTSHHDTIKDGNTIKNESGAFSDKGRMKSCFDYGLNLGFNAVIRQHVKVGVFTEIGFKDIYKQHSMVEELIGDLFGGITKINIGAGLSVGYQF